MTTDEIAALGAPPRPGRGPAWIGPPAPGTLLTRRLPAGPRSFDPKARTFTAVIASEARVRRPPPAPDGELSEWDEILTLTEGAVDLSRVVGGPLLVNHDLNRAESHIGTITAARIENGKLVAELKLSQRASIDSVAEDIANGILRQMSCGYAVETWRKQAGDPPTFTATKWLPLEASILPLAAAGDCMVCGATLESAKMPDSLVKDVD